MPAIVGDIETCSRCNLQACGAFIYATDPSTDVLCLCYAVGDGEIQVWKPGDPVPTPFVNPIDYGPFVWDNWTFDSQIYAHVLVPRYRFAPIPIEQQTCAQRLALANGYPPELDRRCEALGVPYRKDPEARKAMLRIARLSVEDPAKKKRKKTKPVDPARYARDLALTVERCKTDVAATRACYGHTRPGHNDLSLRPLSPQERQILQLDAKINARGVHSNIAFLEAARAFAIWERNAVNVRLNELTAGVITSVFQRDRIIKMINDRGHNLTGLTKRSVSAALAHKPENFVCEMLTLRQRGAYTSAQRVKKILAFADPDDRRIRGALRYHGAHTGRWSSIGVQLHNLPRNDAELPASLIDAVLKGDHTELARWGNPLTVLAGLMRAVICAAPGHTLTWADFAAIESRVLAWLAGETWKLDAFREYDQSGDERLHPYRRIATQMLRKDMLAIVKPERQLGKNAELAFGYGGTIGAWQRIAGDDGRSEAEIKAINRQWRNAHPQTLRFWERLGRAVRIAIQTRQAIRVNPAPAPSIVADFDGSTLTLELPSGRVIAYPGARLVPNRKFEDGNPDVEYFENSQGGWRYARAWFGVLVENVVSGVARDLLAAALLRMDARGWSIVSHCHDEITVEMPDGMLSEQNMLAVMLESPSWATGLPLGGKVHSGEIYFEGPATAEPPLTETLTATDDAVIMVASNTSTEVERAVDAFVASAEPLPATKEVERGAEEDFLASLDETTAPLTDLVSLPMDSSHRVSCPFHEDPYPSCKIYPDHFHCFGCGEHGDRLAWLMRVEGMARTEALDTLHDWTGPITTEQKQSDEQKLDFALSIWNAAQPLCGTLGERYLSATRKIDVSKLPPTINDALRFHPRCVFGSGARHPCIVALMRDPVTDAPVGIQRIGLTPNAEKIDRRMLGHQGVVKLWPAESLLVIGEGLETVLAAATCVPYCDAPLQPAWAALSSDALGRFPVLPNIQRLIVLVDHDPAGKTAASYCTGRWERAGQTLPSLPPTNPDSTSTTSSCRSEYYGQENFHGDDSDFDNESGKR
jgi:DNA polymerase